jgi:hypothetical protein
MSPPGDTEKRVSHGQIQRVKMQATSLTFHIGAGVAALTWSGGLRFEQDRAPSRAVEATNGPAAQNLTFGLPSTICRNGFCRRGSSLRCSRSFIPRSPVSAATAFRNGRTRRCPFAADLSSSWLKRACLRLRPPRDHRRDCILLLGF